MLSDTMNSVTEESMLHPVRCCGDWQPHWKYRWKLSWSMTKSVDITKISVDKSVGSVYNEIVQRHRKGYHMSDAEYEVIKKTFPEWAKKVEWLASLVLNEHHMGMLWGMADAMILTQQCGDANAFVQKAIYNAKKGVVA